MKAPAMSALRDVPSPITGRVAGLGRPDMCLVSTCTAARPMGGMRRHGVAAPSARPGFRGRRMPSEGVGPAHAVTIFGSRQHILLTSISNGIVQYVDEICISLGYNGRWGEGEREAKARRLLGKAWLQRVARSFLDNTQSVPERLSSIPWPPFYSS